MMLMMMVVLLLMTAVAVMIVIIVEICSFPFFPLCSGVSPSWCLLLVSPLSVSSVLLQGMASRLDPSTLQLCIRT